MCFISLIDALYSITMFFISLIAVHTLYCCIVYHCSLFSMISLCVVLYNINMFLYNITTADEVICRQVCRLLSLTLYFNLRTTLRPTSYMLIGSIRPGAGRCHGDSVRDVYCDSGVLIRYILFRYKLDVFILESL